MHSHHISEEWRSEPDNESGEEDDDEEDEENLESDSQDENDDDDYEAMFQPQRSLQKGSVICNPTWHVYSLRGGSS